MLVDLDLTDGNGLALVAELRRDEQWRSMPVLVVPGKRLSGEERAMHDALRDALVQHVPLQ